MNVAERIALLDAIERKRRGWHLSIPREAGTFLGQSVSLEFDKRRSHPVPSLQDSTQLSTDERAVMAAILRVLPAILLECEKQFAAHTSDVPEISQRLVNPHFWIEREILLLSGAAQWTFVVEHADSDVGWHLEFEGTDFQRIWSGD